MKISSLKYPSADLDPEVQQQLVDNFVPEDDFGFPGSQLDESRVSGKSKEFKHRRAFISIEGWMVCSYFLDMLLSELDESKFIDGSVVRVEDMFKNFEYWKGLSLQEREAVGCCVEFLIKNDWFLNPHSDEDIYRLAI